MQICSSYGICSGQVVSHINDVADEDDCVDACAGTDGCQWYSHDRSWYYIHTIFSIV